MMTNELHDTITILRTGLYDLEHAWRGDDTWTIRSRGRELLENCEALERAHDFELRDVRRTAREAYIGAIQLVQVVDGAPRDVLPAEARFRARDLLLLVLDDLAPYVNRADRALRRVLVDGVPIEDALAGVRC
jgi:hypothetical protein